LLLKEIKLNLLNEFSYAFVAQFSLAKRSAYYCVRQF